MLIACAEFSGAFHHLTGDRQTIGWLMFGCCLLLGARILSGGQVFLKAERTLLGALCWVFSVFIFVAAKPDGVAPTAINALQFPRVNGQVFGLEMIVFANQRAIGAVRILLTANLRRGLWFVRRRWCRLRIGH